MYPRIYAKVFSEPWAILPVRHHAIQRALLTHALGTIRADDNPDLDLDDQAPSLRTERRPFQSVGSTAVVPIFGIIGKHLSRLETMCGGCDLDAVSAAIGAAETDPAVDTILLQIHSPGGTVTGVPELAARIAQSAKPIIAFTDSECCSAAYWLASQATAIYCTPSACLGSIGVYMALLDASRAYEDQGLKVNAMSAGEMKLAGADWKPLTDAERAMFQSSVDRIYARFTVDVRAKRQLAAEHMQGQVFDGEQAVELGLADELVQDIEDIILLLDHAAVPELLNKG
jgi:protease-4